MLKTLLTRTAAPAAVLATTGCASNSMMTSVVYEEQFVLRYSLCAPRQIPAGGPP